jgi:glycolate oxidase FAD binding subunit
LPYLVKPTTEAELTGALLAAASRREIIHLFGAGSKLFSAGLVERPQLELSMRDMNRVLKYEPSDLTISVEAGLPWAHLAQLLSENRQTVPLDPPSFHRATVGGVVAANISGPRRRLYGTARDLVIGMRFATLEGKIVQTGGMVVKNVAGLDMAKLLIGSWGTLAAITTVNFKLIPLPLEHRTFVLEFDKAAEAVAARDRILKSVLQPAALDIFSDGNGYRLLIEAGGNTAMMERYEKELGVRGDPDFDWTAIREFTPRFTEQHQHASVARVSSTLSEVRSVLESTRHPVICRAGNGVSYLHFQVIDEAKEWADRADRQNFHFVFEHGLSRDSKSFAADFGMMEKVKSLFDPQSLLNPGRLYGRI